MRQTRSIATGLLFLWGATGCGANWQPVQPVAPQQMDQHTVLEFHLAVAGKDSLVRLHGVVFAHDSVSGIWWLEHLSCDTCRVRYALADISHARTGDPGAGAWGILFPVVIGGVLLFGFAQGLKNAEE